MERRLLWGWCLSVTGNIIESGHGEELQETGEGVNRECYGQLTVGGVTGGVTFEVTERMFLTFWRRESSDETVAE